MLSANFTSHENKLMQVHKEHTHLGNWGWWKEGGAPIRLFCLESAGTKDVLVSGTAQIFLRSTELQ